MTGMRDDAEEEEEEDELLELLSDELTSAVWTTAQLSRSPPKSPDIC